MWRSQALKALSQKEVECPIGPDVTVTVLRVRVRVRVRGHEVRRMRRGDSEECRTAGADREEVAARKRQEQAASQGTVTASRIR